MKFSPIAILAVSCCMLAVNTLYAQTSPKKEATPQTKGLEEIGATRTTKKTTVFDSASMKKGENCVTETICSYKYQCPPNTPKSEVERVCTVVESNCREKTTCN